MTKEKLVEKFLKKPSYLDMGAGKLANTWKVLKEDIYEAKEEARKSIHEAQTAKLKEVIETQEVKLGKYIGSETTPTGSIKKFETTKPLSPVEIEQLAQVDNITTRVNRVWDKLLPNGTWTYAIDIRYEADGFYSKSELEDRLKELFPNIKAQTLPVVKKFSEKALVILISDDHAGALNDKSMYGNEWDGVKYKQRLLHVSNEVKKLGVKFEQVHMLSLGDQLNGWNSQTTRGGHEVKSLSNREQFDIYVQGRREFYDDLFTSGVSASYFVHDVENSNHSGKDFSYIANSYLDLYLSSKFPEVSRKSYFLPIESFDYGIHTIGFTHGKDESLMTRPLPLKLDPRTDLFLFQYFDKKGYSPANRRISMYKGDLHTYAMDMGKFGRYINIPSIMGPTDWTEVNFGDSQGGALLEIYEKDSKSIQHIPIWF